MKITVTIKVVDQGKTPRQLVGDAYGSLMLCTAAWLNHEGAPFIDAITNGHINVALRAQYRKENNGISHIRLFLSNKYESAAYALDRLAQFLETREAIASVDRDDYAQGDFNIQLFAKADDAETIIMKREQFYKGADAMAGVQYNEEGNGVLAMDGKDGDLIDLTVLLCKHFGVNDAIIRGWKGVKHND